MAFSQYSAQFCQTWRHTSWRTGLGLQHTPCWWILLQG